MGSLGVQFGQKQLLGRIERTGVDNSYCFVAYRFSLYVFCGVVFCSAIAFGFFELKGMGLILRPLIS